MEQILSMTGKEGFIFLFDDRVIFQKFNQKEWVVPYATISFVMYRPICRDKSGFIKLRSPGGPSANFDYVVPKLGVIREQANGPSNSLLWEVFSKIQELRIRFQGYPGPNGFPADQIFPGDFGFPPIPACFTAPSADGTGNANKTVL
jgi:hypothetical protein